MDDGCTVCKKVYFAVFHAGVSVLGTTKHVEVPPEAYAVSIYNWQLSLYGTKLYQTKPTDKDGGLEASRSCKGQCESCESWRMIGEMRGRKKSERQWWRRNKSWGKRGEKGLRWKERGNAGLEAKSSVEKGIRGRGSEKRERDIAEGKASAPASRPWLSVAGPLSQHQGLQSCGHIMKACLSSHSNITESAWKNSAPRATFINPARIPSLQPCAKRLPRLSSTHTYTVCLVKTWSCWAWNL